jgi:hypothetical protein
MTKAARVQLMNSVLTSVVTYHATVIPLPKWLIKKINKIRRNFFWKGDDQGYNGGICFGRALHQWWLWYRWTDDSKPWQGMTLPCDAQDRALFQASAEIRLGNGKKASFWQDKWLDGNAPKEIAPNLFKLARFKNRTMAKELENNNWIHAARHLSTREELLEYVKQWGLLANVSLNTAVTDSVAWKWTADGMYSSASAYKIQFQGSFPPFKVGKLWKTKIEPKVKVFGWTAMHQKILMADNLAARGMQHNSIYPLCNVAPETARHLLIDCPFSMEVLSMAWSWFGLGGSATTCPADEDPASWLCEHAQRAIMSNQKKAMGILLYV